MNLDIDISMLDSEFREEENRLKRLVKATFQRAGDTYVAMSRERGSYKDQTENLRNANGYQIEEDGSVIESHIDRDQTKRGFSEMGSSADMVLKAGNGMEYASYVEAKNYDVTSSGQLAAEAVVRKAFG